MALAIGTRIGSFEITGVLGAGGMGEVYRARDLKLGREVAIKILPDAFRSDPGRLARFEREARTLATINHPNIASIYGVEEAAGTTALVIELVEGQALADRLRRGPFSMDEAVAIATQLAHALDAAHEKDIIHRDLKPANVMVTTQGVVKVLDFGLAKVAENRSARELAATETAVHTGDGVILGTAAYMSPEQARGQTVDKRTDIWAFGCVLFEMLAGRQAFAGETTSDLVAAILEREPDWRALPAETTPALRRLLRRCLDKDPRRRLRDIGDIALEQPEEVDRATARTTPIGRWLLTVAAALATGAGLGWLVAGSISSATVTPAPLRVFIDTLAEGRQFEGGSAGTGSMVALSPDGRTLAYVAEESGEPRLFVRPLDRLDQVRAAPIPDRGAREPFFSPDGEWLGFRVGQTLKRVSLKGGPVESLVDLPRGSASIHGVSWGADGTILAGTGLAGLVRIRMSDGNVETLVTPTRKRLIMYPQALPGGQAVIYTESGGTPESSELMVVDLASRTSRPLRQGSIARYLPSGHLVFVAGSTLWAAAFDLARLTLRGAAVPVVKDVRVNPEVGAAQIALTDAGGLAYLPVSSAQRTLVWVSRDGRETPVGAPPRAYSLPRVSPDGTRIAVTMKESGQDIHLWDIAHGVLRQLTFNPSPNTTMAWLTSERVRTRVWSTAGGRRSSCVPTVSGCAAAHKRDALVPVHRLAGWDGAHSPWYPPDGAWDIGIVPIQPPGARQTVERTKATENNPVLSPDGRWLAYQSNKTGRFEIYARPFPAFGQGESR